jgi:hypothetical protein
MIKEYLLQLSIIYILLFATFLHSIFVLKWKQQTHRYVLIILSVFMLNETISLLGKVYFFSFKINITITTIIHTVLWLLILKKSVRFPRIVTGLMLVFITFSLSNVFFIEGWILFNCYTFILGAFMYLIVFLIESFYQLKQENFSFFFSNQFLLLMVPVLLFIGLTFMFGFKSHEVISTVFFGKIELYRIIILIVNIVYYTLLNIYIYREKKQVYDF